MSAELSIYKQNRINELNTNFNTVLARLNSILASNIRVINSSRLNAKQKQQQINTLIVQYNNNVNNLKSQLSKNISIIQTYQLKPVIINKNKKALLMGINYIGSQYQLNGCISDVNSIKERLLKQGFIDSNINILTDNTSIKPTKTNILSAFKDLLNNLLINY